MLDEGVGAIAADDDVIHQTHIDERERLLEFLGDAPVRHACCGVAAGVIVRDDDRCRIQSQCFLEHFARVERCRASSV